MVTSAPRPPSRALAAIYRRVVNPVIRLAVLRLGAGGSGVKPLAILRVQGRKTGRVREVPVGVVALDEHRYVMTMLGNEQWARNLRAAGGGQLVSRKRAREVTAREITGQEKTAFLARCCQHRQWERPARIALKSAFGRTVKHLGEPEIDLLGQVWFVFQLLDADPDSTPLQPTTG
jgi:deazaflavin-dependent oxidoreductase (nitroreductase family)